MYVKLFSSILDSTIWAEGPETRIVWITMLAMADKDGDVRCSPSGLARRANVTPEAAHAAVEQLLAPDADSATPDHEGRRIEAQDGGWHILNYVKYRQIQDREARKESWRKASKRRYAATKAERVSTFSAEPLQNSTEAEAEAEADTNNSTAHAERFGHADQLTAYQELRKAASLGTSFDAGLAAVAQPPSGGPAYGWQTIGRALGDFYAANGAVRMTPAALRAFCRRIVSDDARPADQLPRGTSKQERGRAALADTLTRRGFTNGLDHSNSQVPSTIPRALPDPGHHEPNG